MKQITRVLATLLAVGLALASAGCGKASIANLGQELGAKLQADGRTYGQSYEADEDSKLSCQFFSYQVNSAKLLSVVEGYTADDASHALLVVNITVKNIFEDNASIPMSNTDFELGWDALGDATQLPETPFSESQLLDEWTMFKGETKTGDLVYMVPADITKYNLIYKEVYEDDFEGNSYTIHFNADTSEYKPLGEGDSLQPLAGNGKTITASGAEPLNSSFFQFQVNSCKLEESVAEHVPNQTGDRFLVVNVTIKNTFGESLPMFASDFRARWGDGEDQFTIADDKFTEGQLETQWTLSKDASSTGDLIFMVPQDQTAYELVYEEIYEDGSVGDVYAIQLDL